MGTVQIAEVQDIQGTAYAVNADGGRRLLEAGDALFDGESVESAEGSVVELTLSDGQSLVIAGQPVFLISADLIADLAPGADESALQTETLDELLVEGSLESLEQIINSAEDAEAERLDDLLAAAEEDPTASGIDFDNLAATAAGGDDSGAGGGGSTIVQATRITSSGDATSATLTEGNTQAAASADIAGGTNNSLSVAVDDAFAISEDTPSVGNLADNDALAGDVTFALLDQAGPSNGAVTLNEDGTFVFTPSTDFVGEDSFQYVITDANGQTSTATVSITVEAVNDAPVALDDVVTAQEDVLLENINVLDNDTDSDGNPLTVTNAVSAAGGVVRINADGTLSYQAPANFTGPDTINYTIDDGAGGTSTAVVNIDVAPVADLAAADDFNTGDEDTVISGSVADNDTTLSGGALTYAVESTVEKGALIFNADGSYEYTPNPNFNGADRFTYVVTDADSGESLTQSVTLTVDAISDLTAAVDQNTGDQDTVISGSVADNDSTSSGGTLTYVIESGVKSGTLTLNADGAYNYTPSAGFNGTDSFSYIVTDSGSGERVTQTVTITVNALTEAPVDETPIDETPIDVNQAPIAQDDRAEIVQNVPLRNIKVLDNDEDPEGGVLTVTSAESASGALVSINADGTLNYTPNVDFLGADSVTYTITDAEGATAQASLVVVISEPQAQNALEGEPLDVYLKDTAWLRSLPAGTTVTVASSQGSLVSISEDGVMSYQAPPGFTGEDVITYTTDDGQGNVVTKTVVMQVYPQDAALVGIDDAVVTPEDASVLNIAVLANDKIAEGSDVTVIAASSSRGGQVEINADGTLNYAPLQDFTGIDTVTYTARNGDGIESTATLSVEVTPENDPPVAVVDAVTTLEDTPLENINVLGNDIDVDGDTLTVLEVSSAKGAEVTLNDDGTVNYQPNANFNGVDTITYSVSDGLGGVTTGELKISVEAVNDAPVVTGEQVSAVQNEAIDAIAVLLNDEDPDGNSLSVEAAVASSGGTVEINEDGTLKYTPAPDFVGEETLTYTVIDGQGGRVEGQATVSVASLGDGPVAKDDSASVDEDALLKNINVLGNDTDANNDALTVTAAVSTAGGAVTINADGTLNYLPLANFTGEDTITYTISDGNGGASTATVTVTVESVNDTPVAVAANEGTSEETVLNGAVPAATDIDGTILSYALVNNVAEGGLTLNVDGSYRFDPGSDFDDLAEGESRDVTFTYTATDNEDQVSAPATVTITVTGTGDAPVASAATQVTNENTVLEATVAATSVDSVIASYAVATDLADQGQGSLTFNEDGSYRFAPGSDFDDLADGESREVAFSYTATDENGGVSAPATVTITVTGTNDTPVATNASVETLEDTSIIELDVLANVIDIDGDALTLVSVESEAGGTITLNEGGTINYGPAENYFGSDTLTYVATDPTGESVTGSIVIDIIAVNDAPVVVGETIVTDEDAAVNNIVVLSNDSDIEGDALSVTEASSVNGGTVTINEDGTLNYTPPVNFNGTDTIEYTVTDAGSAASVGAVLVTVNPIDDQPIASTLDAATDKGVAIEGDLSQRVESGDGPMTYALTLGAEPQHGVVTVNEDGTFIYTPDADFSGRERFGYTVTDEDGDQSSSVVTIQVVADSFSANSPSDLPNDVPLAAADNYQVDEDTPITARVTINDDLSTDGDGANVVTVAESDGPSHGALTMSEAGVFVYTPDTNYFGADSFRYTLTDANGDTSSAVVTLNVGQVNDEAVFEGDVSGTMLEDGGLDRPLGEGAEVTPIIGALSATDFLGGVLEDTGLAGIDNLGTENGFRIAVDDQYVQAQGGVATIDADGNWAYTPNANFNGPDSFTVLVTDDLGNVESQVINVTVDVQTDLSAADDAISVDEDDVLNASVADNDSTISGGALTYALAAGATVGNGELLFNEDGSYTYTPNTDYYGPDSFSYVVTDAASGESSTQAVSITVNPVVEANAITIDRIEGDSGVAGDFQTNDTTLTVSGSLEKAIASDERVEISTDGGETWTTVTVDGTNWSFEDPTEQDASFTFVVRIAGPGDSVGATAEQAITIDTTPPVATIQLDDAITSDNIINAQESGEAITISGSVGGEARVGDTVTLTVNGVQSQAAVESIEGALRFSVNIPGADLVADGDLAIDAAITTTDDAGNISEVATDVQTYAVDLEAFATITVEVLPELEGVALENAIAVAAYRGDDLNVTGVAGLDAADAGEITLTVNGNTYTGTVGEQGTYSIAIAAADLVDAESAAGTTRAISVTVEASDEAGNPATASAATDVLVRPVQQVQFTDNYVDGVSYSTTSGLSGTTGTNESTGEAGAQGSFLYRAGDTITLTLGSVIIAEFSADQVQGNVLFLQDIAGVALSDVNNDYVENMAIFLQTLDADASADNGIQITPETAAFFEGYTDSGTGEALNIATAGKQLLANALTAAANAVDDQGNSLNLLPADFEFSADSETDQDGANDEGLLENTFETVAIQHVADTIDELGADRQTDLFAFDDRQSDTIDAGTGIIEYAYVTDGNTVSAMNFSAYAISERTGQPVGLLANATPQQVSLDNMVVENVQVGPEYAGIVESVVYDDVTKEGTITLVEGVTPEQLEGLYLTYRVKDWTAVTETTATAIDTYRSHLSSDAGNVSEDAQYNQFTLTSALTFDTDQALTVKISPQSFGDNFAEYADDFLVPMEYSTDGGATWQVMDQVGTYTRDGYDLPLPLFGFTLAAGQDTLEVRISVFDDQTIETDEVIDLLIEGENFYPERVQPGILDNETQATLPIVDIDYAVVSEGDGVAVLTVTLSEAADGDVTVDYTTGDLGATAGEDYQAISGTITIPEGQTSFQVEVSLIDDTVEEDTEFLVVNLSNVSANAVLADPQATVRILDNENNTAPTVEAAQADGQEDPSSPIEVTLTGSDNDPYDAVSSFTLSGLPANGILYSDASLTSAVTAGAAYAATSESLTLYFVPDANWNGETTFGYKGSDGELESAEAVATITITSTEDVATLTSATGTFTESDATQSTTGTLTLSDDDATDATVVAQTNAAGTYGTFTIDAAGAWTYNMAANDALDANQVVTDTFTVATSDGGSSSVVITITGTEDVATLTSATGTFTESDATQSTTGTLTLSDDDATDATVVAQTNAAGTYGTFTIDAAGAWTYNMAANDALDANQVVTDTFTVATSDGGSSSVVITITGTEDVATLTSATGTFTESDATQSTTGTLTLSDDDATDATVVAQTNAAGTYGTFTIDAAGAWTYNMAANDALDANQVVTDTFTVATSDGGSSSVVITITGTEDVATLTSATGTFTESDATQSTTGTLTLSDDDATDATVVAQTNAAGTYGTFTIDAAGAWTYNMAANDALDANQVVTDTFTVATSDGGSSSVVITITGTEDVATLTSATGTFTESDATQSTTGTLTLSDDDATDATVVAQTNAAGTYGTFTIDAAGAWTYNMAANDALDANQVVTDTFTVATSDGGSSSVVITITGTEDVATLTSATGTFTESDATQSTTGTLTLSDDDATDATVVAQTNAAGTYGTFTIDAAGAWTYNMAANDALDANQVVTDTFTVATSDGGSSSVVITITGTEDVATLTSATGTFTESDATQSTTGTLTLSDDDATDATVVAQTNAAGTYGTFTIDAAGAWTYNMAANDALDANQVVTDTFTVATSDGGSSSVVITITGTEDVATLTSATGTFTESDATQSTTGTLTLSDDDATDATVVAQTNAAGTYGTFTIDAAGAWTYNMAANDALDANQVVTDTFTVATSDGGSSSVVITITGTEDVATLTSATGTFTESDATQSTTGTLTLSDDDATDATVVAQTNAAGTYGTFTIDAAGAWTYNMAANDALDANQVVTDTFTVATSDGGSSSVVITITGTEDVATLTSATGTFTESDATQSTTGTLTLSDDDATDATVVAQTNAAGTYGTFTIDAAGAWTYNMAANDALDANQVVTDTFTVATSDGGSSSVVITITGTEDVATLTSATGTFTESDATQSTTGTLTLSDDDATDATVVAQTNAAGTYGTFTIDAAGAWTYNMAANDALDANQVVTDTFTVATSDGGSSSVVITITGTEDVATLTSATGTFTESDATQSTTGTLTLSDDDATDATVVAQTNAAGTYGTFTIDAAGAWTYNMAANDALDANQVVTDTFTVATSDGGSSSVVITITGTEDVATLTSATGTFTESDATQSTTGTLTLSDDDATDATVVAQTNAAGTYGTFTIDAAGAWTYNMAANDALDANQVVTDTFTVATSDGGSSSVVITITGTEDVATLTSATGTFTESDATQSTTGTLTLSDDDATDATVVAQTNAAGTYGTFTIDAAGAWTYNMAANDALDANQVVTDTFTVATSDGGSSSVVITITGTEDVATLTSATGTFTESDATQSTTGTLTLSDDDATDATVVAQTNAAGTYGTFTIDAAGAWTYNMAANDALDANQVVTDTFTVATSDGGSSSVVITITGTEDVATLTSATGTFTESDATQSTTGTLTLSDDDATDATVVAQTNAAGTYGTFTIDAAGAWTYNMAANDALDANQVVTDTFTVATSDGGSSSVVITITGTEDVATLTSATGTFTESDATQSTTGTLTLSDDDATDATVVAQTNAAGTYGTFTIDAAGAWTYNMAANDALDANQVVTDTFTVATSDGGSSSVVITITGTEDVATLTSATGTFTESDATQSTTGTLTLSDDDATDATVVAQTNAAGTYGTFTIDAAGAWTYNMAANDALDANQVVTDTFTVATSDGGSSSVVITITGTEDVATLTSATGTFTESDATQSTTGTLTLSDDDATDATVVAQTNAAGTYGTFTIDAAGAWTYNMAANDALDANQVVTDTFTVATSDGGSSSVVITITGTEDVATLTSATGTFTESDATQSTTGTLTLSDDDATDATVVAQTNAAGTYGTFTIDAAGAWTYNMAANDALDANQVVTDTFTVATSDGGSSSVVITITGTEDVATLTSATGTFTESDATQSTTGTLTLSDDDATDATVVAQTNAAGTYGTFTIDAAGAWTYNMAANDALDANQVVTDTFTVATSDGGSSSVVITITGTEDVATLTSATGTFTESDATQSTTGTLTLSDDDATDATVVAQTNAAGTYGTFTIDAAGAWTYNMAANDALDANQVVTDTFTVATSDGGSSSVVITITGTEDVATLTSATGTFTESDATQSTTGTLTLSDDDATDATVVAQTNAAGTYGTFTIDAAGAWTYNMAANDALDANQVVTDTFTVATSDGGSSSVVITITGTEDVATLTSATGTFTESDATQSTTGTLTLSDDDATDATVVAQTNAAGTYGTFTIDAAGAWTYNMAANDALDANQVVTDTFTVATSDGGSSSVVITITGTEDVATLTSATGTFTESDATQSTTGTLTLSDDDATDATVVAQTNAAGTYGTFTIDAAGAWTYNMAANDALDANQVVTDTFTVATSDGGSSSVVITITGTNDGPVITGTDAATVVEDATPNTLVGNLDYTDVDNDNDAWTAVTTSTTSGNGYGTFTMTTAGVWTYTLDNTNAIVNALNDGATLPDSFVVTTQDGTTKTVNITINGSTDSTGTLSIAPAAEAILTNVINTETGVMLNYSDGGDGGAAIPVTFTRDATGGLANPPQIFWSSSAGGSQGFITWTLDGAGTTLTGSVGSTSVFKIVLDGADNDYDVSVQAPGLYYAAEVVSLSGDIFDSAGGGNNAYVGVTNVAGSNLDIVVSALGDDGNAGTVNESSSDIGVNNQWISEDESLTFDFFSNSELNDKVATFDSSSLTTASATSFTFTIAQTQGNGNADFQVILTLNDGTTETLTFTDEEESTSITVTNSIGFSSVKVLATAGSGSFGLALSSVDSYTAVADDQIISFDVTAEDVDGDIASGSISIGLDQDGSAGVTIGGTVVDGVVAGLFYSTSSGVSGITDARGHFQFELGDTVTFSIGSVVVGSISAASALADGKLFLQEIAGVGLENITDDYVEKLAIFLQTLDNDGDAYNGIVITDEMHALFSDDNFDLEAITKEELVQLLLDNGLTPVDEDEAIQHVKDMITEHAGVTEFEEDDNDSISLLGDDEGLDLAWSLSDPDEPVDGMYLSDEADQVSLEIGDLLGDGIPDSDLSQYISVASDGLNTVIEVNNAGIGNTEGGASMSYTLGGVDLTTDVNGNALDTDSMNELLRNLYNGANDTGLM